MLSQCLHAYGRDNLRLRLSVEFEIAWHGESPFKARCGVKTHLAYATLQMLNGAGGHSKGIRDVRHSPTPALLPRMRRGAAVPWRTCESRHWCLTAVKLSALGGKSRLRQLDCVSWMAHVSSPAFQEPLDNRNVM